MAMTGIIKKIKDEIILIPFLILLLVLMMLYPSKITQYPYFVDWRTIIALAGLLITVTGLKDSGYLRIFLTRIITLTKNERRLAVFLILVSALLSTFLTNDVTLFIVVPLTIELRDSMDILKLVSLEAIAVNVGSALTPIGNPQNIFLWHMWNIPFTAFIEEMLPFELILLVILLIYVYNFFKQTN